MTVSFDRLAQLNGKYGLGDRAQGRVRRVRESMVSHRMLLLQGFTSRYKLLSAADSTSQASPASPASPGVPPISRNLAPDWRSKLALRLALWAWVRECVGAFGAAAHFNPRVLASPPGAPGCIAGYYRDTPAECSERRGARCAEAMNLPACQPSTGWRAGVCLHEAMLHGGSGSDDRPSDQPRSAPGGE